MRTAVPYWVRELLNKPLSEAESLPPVSSSASEGTLFRPVFDATQITPSYLGFLDLEIRSKLHTRRSVERLTSRSSALSPFEGASVYTVMFSRMVGGVISSVWLAVRRDDCSLIYIETLGVD